MRLKIVALTGLVAAAIGAGPASAQTTVYADNNGKVSIPIPVKASVGGRCEFALNKEPQGSFDAGKIDEVDWTHDFPFEISCNTASRVAVVSLNGGLKTSQTVTDAGYLGLAPYSVQLVLDGDSTAADQTCDVANLAASATTACTFRGPASATDGLRLEGPSREETGSKLVAFAPAYAGPGTLVSGTYSDTLTVTIAAAP